MTLECILDELKIIFKQINPNLDVDSVTLDTRLVEDLGLDSITILLLSFAIEKKSKSSSGEHRNSVLSARLRNTLKY